MKTFAMFVGFVLACAVAVNAEEGKKKERKMPAPAEMFAKMDKDGDKIVTEKEFVGDRKEADKAKERFKKMGGTDKGLTLEQFTKAMEEHKAKHAKGDKPKADKPKGDKPKADKPKCDKAPKAEKKPDAK